MAFIALSWDSEQKNLNVKIWAHVKNFTNLSDHLSNLVADFKVPIECIPVSEKLVEDFAPSCSNEKKSTTKKHNEESVTVELDELNQSEKLRHNNTTVRAEDFSTETPSLVPENAVTSIERSSHATEDAITSEETPSHETENAVTEQQPISNYCMSSEAETEKCNEIHKTETAEDKIKETVNQQIEGDVEKTDARNDEINEEQVENNMDQQIPVENKDIDTSSSFSVFINYLKSKEIKMISSKNNETWSYAGRNGVTKNLTPSEGIAKRRSSECIGRPGKKLKLDPFEIQSKPSTSRAQFTKDQHKQQNGIHAVDPNGNSNSESNNRADRVSVCSDNDYTLLIDEDQPEMNISPTKKSVNLKKLVSTSPKKNWKPVSTSSPHAEIAPFSCRSCKRFFNRECNYKMHMKSNHDPKFTCPICDVQFVLRSEFKLHFRTHYIGKRIVEKNTKQSFACKRCGSKFDTSKKLTVHMKQHSGKPIPTYSLWQSSRLNLHVKSPKK